jgi:hypothetical protein
MIGDPVKYAPDYVSRTSEGQEPIQPQLIHHSGDDIVINGARGCSLIVIGGDDVAVDNGRLAIMLYATPVTGSPVAIGLVHPMDPDIAEEFADHIKAAAQAMRDRAAGLAADVLKRAGGGGR